MQQWVLLQVGAAEWQRLDMSRLLPSMVGAWGSLSPPKRDARWICFPYLAAPPPCTLDLPALMAEGGYATLPAPSAHPLPVAQQVQSGADPP